MLFKVTHISVKGERTQKQVDAPSNAVAMDKVEQACGEARVLYCVCLPVPQAGRRAPLRVVARKEGLCA